MQLNYNFDNIIGKIKPMHGVGQPPTDGPDDFMFHYLTEAGIPYSRLHDVGGSFGDGVYVDIHNIFRNFDADVEDPESYDFAFTDWLLLALERHGVEPIYRLGETIENYHYIKAYRIFPPKDPKKWARICEHIIKHYNYGWANGYHMGIKYWEIWNEPDNGIDNTQNQMWHGTKEEFYELYSVAATHLKEVFGDEIKVGGYATCGFRHIHSDPERYGIDAPKSDDECYSSARSRNFIDFFEGFMDYIGKTKAPMDFFSWHSYLPTDRTVITAGYVKRRLAEYGYEGIETQMNEWNNVCEDRGDPTIATDMAKRLRGTSMAAAKTISMMLAMQNTDTDVLCYYDAGLGTSYYRGMWNPMTCKPFPLYYSFVAFNELYKLGGQIECSENRDGVYTLGATDGKKRAVVIANESDVDIEIDTNLPSDMDAYIIAEGLDLGLIEIDVNKFTIPSGTVILFKN